MNAVPIIYIFSKKIEKKYFIFQYGEIFVRYKNEKF